MEVAKCGNNVKALHENLLYVDRWLAQAKRSQQLADTRAHLKALRLPRRCITVVDENWLPHMKECKDRHMALVLDGPSRFGKTTFCKQLVQDESEYLEINCLNLTSPPNLRMISPETRLICFDEATVRWCLDNKKDAAGTGDGTHNGRFAIGVSQLHRRIEWNHDGSVQQQLVRGAQCSGIVQ